MRTAIVTTPRTQSFQYGGQALPPGLPQGLPPGAPGLFPPPVEQQQASPVQGPPGASGVTPQAIPPQGGGDQGGPTAQLPVQQQAIETGPAASAQPHGVIPDPDVDLQREKQEEDAQFNSEPVSVQNGKILNSKPKPLTLDDHRDIEKLRQAQELTDQLAAQAGPKGNFQVRDAIASVRQMRSRMQKEIDAQNRQDYAEWSRTTTAAQKKADEHYDNRHTTTDNAEMIERWGQKAADIKKVMDNGKPQDAQQAAVQAKVTPLATMSEQQRILIARNLKALNPQLTNEMAADAVVLLGSPVLYGDQPVNGKRGKAGANYQPVRPDIVGHYVLQTDWGPLRINSAMYTQLKNARYKGWNEFMKYRQDKAEAARKAAEPGFIGRMFQ